MKLSMTYHKLGSPAVESDPDWFYDIARLCEKVPITAGIRQYLYRSSERMIYTAGLLKTLGIVGKKACELGPGGIGLVCARQLGVRLDAYDCVEDFFKPVYEGQGIPWYALDMNCSARLRAKDYEFIVFCEVFEHLARWPVDTLAELRQCLIPGGVMLLTTQNLHRLSQRIRMLQGKTLFAPFVKEELCMGHLREYAAVELGLLLRKAGFAGVHYQYCAFPDLRSPKTVQVAYRSLCRMLPKLSNYIFVWATAEPCRGVRE